MWLTKSRNWQGPVFGAVDKFEGLGIFVDTYRNNRPGVNFPYVMAMLGDGQTPYDQEHDGLANEVAGCSARGLRNSAHPTRMRLTYFAEGNLTVSLVYKTDSPEDWTECFSTSEITIPSVSYLGFTAETGELSDNHDILKVDTKNLYTVAAKDLPSSGDNTVRGSGKGRSSYDGGYGGKKKSGGWGWFFIKFVLLIVICGGAYVGFTIWRTQQRGRSSRF
ncbi:MAG: camp-dependent protein kinase catalytic subunit [Chaenotheca gracillima]|nr:MAG: camp-dependent protein kinase catalytic subunit [Chaenotheca gracillima]